MKPLLRFVLLALGLFLGWYLLYDLWLLPDGRADTWLSVQTARAAGGLFSLFGYETAVDGRTLIVDGRPCVYIDDSCNGMVLLAIFTGFIVAFPGPLLFKLWFIPVGWLLVATVNVLRVVALALNLLLSESSFEFNHKYTYTFAVYGCILLLWMWWVKRFSGASYAH